MYLNRKIYAGIGDSQLGFGYKVQAFDTGYINKFWNWVSGHKDNKGVE